MGADDGEVNPYRRLIDVRVKKTWHVNSQGNSRVKRYVSLDIIVASKNRTLLGLHYDAASHCN
jgi:hypothetical protein